MPPPDPCCVQQADHVEDLAWAAGKHRRAGPENMKVGELALPLASYSAQESDFSPLLGSKVELALELWMRESQSEDLRACPAPHWGSAGKLALVLW